MRCKYIANKTHGTFRDEHGEVKRKCEFDALNGSDFCIFHAPPEEKDRNAFYEAIHEFLEGGIKKLNELGIREKQYYCIDLNGFKFPVGSSPFNNLEIPARVSFIDAEFDGRGGFFNVVFKAPVAFTNTKFGRGVYFGAAVFLSEVHFLKTVFGNGEENGFNHWDEGCRFEGNTIFSNCEFRSSVLFSGVKFIGPTNFWYSEFWKGGSFERSKIFNDASFTIIRDINDRYPVVDFMGVETQERGRLIFENCELNGWAFANTLGLENAFFIREGWKPKGGKGRKQTRDEILLKKPGANIIGITPGVVGEVYRRLRLNYERRLAYEEACDFHIGQMEMMWLNPGTGDMKRFALGLYKIISNYGESIGRPLFWFAFLWLVATPIWVAAGFEWNPGTSVNWDYILPWKCNWYWEGAIPVLDTSIFGDIGRSILYAFKTFLTLPERGLSTANQVLGAVQRVMGVSVITLFILALRRAFRR